MLGLVLIPDNFGEPVPNIFRRFGMFLSPGTTVAVYHPELEFYPGQGLFNVHSANRILCIR